MSSHFSATIVFRISVFYFEKRARTSFNLFNGFPERNDPYSTNKSQVTTGYESGGRREWEEIGAVLAKSSFPILPTNQKIAPVSPRFPKADASGYIMLLSNSTQRKSWAQINFSCHTGTCNKLQYVAKERKEKTYAVRSCNEPR